MDYLLVICAISLGQIQLTHAGDSMEHPLNEESSLETLNLDGHTISKHFFEDFNIFETILHSILENRSAGALLHNSSESRCAEKKTGCFTTESTEITEEETHIFMRRAASLRLYHSEIPFSLPL